MLIPVNRGRAVSVDTEGLQSFSPSMKSSLSSSLSAPYSEASKKLNDKCVRALQKSYSYATADNNNQRKINARFWNSNYRSLYNYSKNVISGIVQNWYLSIGKTQEGQAMGSFSENFVEAMQNIWFRFRYKI